MKCSLLPRPWRTPSLFVSVLAAGIASCGGDAKPEPTATDGAAFGAALGLPGESVVRRNSTKVVITDPNSEGTGQNLLIEEMFWGRLANVYERPSNGARILRHADLLVGENLGQLIIDGRLEPSDITVEDNFITGGTNVIIHHESDTAEYADALLAIREGLQPVNAHPDLPTEFGSLTMIPRNAALAIRMSDLLATSSVSSDTIRVFQGSPPETPFEPRIFVDENHGQLFEDRDNPGGDYIFRSSRVIVDFAVSVTEASESTTLLSVNAEGLPPSPDQENPNVSVRIPTQNAPELGSFATVTNLSGNPLSSADVLTDSSSATLDIVRGLRSGGPSDENNGYLFDDSPPSIVTQLSVSLGNIRCVSGICPDPGNQYLVDIEFSSELCARLPEQGDLIELEAGLILRVISDAVAISDQAVANLLVEDLTEGDLNTIRVALSADATAPGQFLTPLDSQDLEAGLARCFVAFSPEANSDLTEIAPNSTIKIRFSEPMDPGGLNGLEDFIVTSGSDTEFGPTNIVVADSRPTPDLRRYSFEPKLPFSHSEGTAEPYFIKIGAQATRGLSDLAGNRVAEEIPWIPFTLDPSADTDTNGGFVLRFNAEDFATNLFNEDPEDDTNARGPEIAGQFIHNADRGVIRPRPVVRFSMVVDRDNQVVSNMDNLPLDPLQTFVVLPIADYIYELGTNEPMTPFGSRMMTVWRYCDMGLALNSTPAPESFVWDEEDASFYNVDVESISWAVNGAVQADQYQVFEIALAHSARLPDEEWWINPLTLAPTLLAPGSGLLEETFDSNVMPDGTDNPLKVVHPRNLGYLVDPGIAFRAATDQLMMPYPLNQGSDPSQYRYYTWRDTAIQGVAGDETVGASNFPSNTQPILGVPSTILWLTLGLDNEQPSPEADEFSLFDPEAVEEASGLVTFSLQGWLPSVAMPLLMDFRCFPDSGSGFNKPQYTMAGFVQSTVPPFGTSAPANFRIASTGGVTVTNNVTKVNPDLTAVPAGGFNQNPNTAPAEPVGARTPASDSLFKLGQLDLVYRVSRVYTRWIQSLAATSCDAAVIYEEPVLVPSNNDQPTGTSVELAYRGAAAVTLFNPSAFVLGPLADARVLDAYGDERDLNPAGTPLVFGDPTLRNDSVSFCPATGGLGGESWYDNIQDIDGAAYFQVRLTMINNVRSGVSPSLTAIGFVFDIDD